MKQPDTLIEAGALACCTVDGANVGRSALAAYNSHQFARAGAVPPPSQIRQPVQEFTLQEVTERPPCFGQVLFAEYQRFENGIHGTSVGKDHPAEHGNNKLIPCLLRCRRVLLADQKRHMYHNYGCPGVKGLSEVVRLFVLHGELAVAALKVIR